MTPQQAPFRNSAELARARLRPTTLVETENPSPVAETWNRIGGLFQRMSKFAGLSPASALAVWMVESGVLKFVRARPVLRFENHKFFNTWGNQHESLFDSHFQFGGRKDIQGRAWEQHRYRNSPAGEWQRFHGDQSAEYMVFALASRLAGTEAACLSSSFGGPQIMGFNHALIGYRSASEMFRAFGRSERWQVCGFFDFCHAGKLIGTLAQQNWHGFATVYNGPGNADAYAAKIAEAHAFAAKLLGVNSPETGVSAS
jgi:N-acetylmuramidase